MFTGLLHSAKSAVSGLLLKYVARASVAIPFVIAAGFALAACTMMLVERFGHITAYWMVAGGLAVVGVIAAAVVSAKEEIEEEARASRRGERYWRGRKRCGGTGHDAGADCRFGRAVQHSGGTSAALGTARLLGRNWPLAILIGLIGLLYWPSGPENSELGESSEADPVPPLPNGHATVPDLRSDYDRLRDSMRAHGHT